MIRLCLGLGIALGIAACSPPTSVRSIALLEGEIIAITPDGYCVDGEISKPGTGFAVMAPCATLGEPENAPDIIGFATVQVGPRASGAVTGAEIAMRDFLITEAGAGLLSQAGNAQDVNILSTQAFNSQVMVHFADEGPPPFAGLQSEEWRAFTDINGRLVTIAVRGLAVAPLQDGPGAGLLKLILAGVQAATESLPESEPEV